MRHRLLLVTLSVLFATTSAPSSADATALHTPRFVRSACPQSQLVPIPQLNNARCGYLIVPENRATQSGRTIRLAVAIIPSVSKRKRPDPIVHLTGGPGGIAMFEAPQLVRAGLNRDRDLILMDQRGTLFDTPELTCPEIDNFNARSLGLVYDAASTARLHVAATRACRRRLAARGIDLGAYNTTENAADFSDLRRALGIARWNVFGVSYGTDLALTLMREHPEGIRSVILDSVVPPSFVAPSKFWPAARDGFDALFRACASQAACRTQHPGLGATFTALVRQLERQPVTTTVQPRPTAPSVKVVLDGGALVNWLVSLAFHTPDLVQVPNWISELAAGRPQAVAIGRASGVAPPGFVGYGLTYGVTCGEWVPYERRSAILDRGRQAFPSYPTSVLAQPPQLPFIDADCRAWSVPKAPAAQRAVTRSRIPTLLLSGGFDPVAPRRWAQVAARTLPNSTSVTIPGVGHFVLPESPCAQQVAASFLATPRTPNTGCVAHLQPPPFATATGS